MSLPPKSIACAVFLFVQAPGPARAEIIPTTYWLNPEHGWVMESRACETGLCAFIVGFRGLLAGAMPRDAHNTNPALRSRPLCGLQLVGGFDESMRRGNSADGGWVYDPDSGQIYAAKLTLANPDTVKLRGYVGIPYFGRTITLHRQDKPGELCAPPAG